MMRYIIGLALCLLLTSCWNDDGSSTTASPPAACPYQAPKSVPTYVLSPYPDQMHIAVDQGKLTRFMSVAASQATCYLASEDQVVLSKIPGLRDSNPQFASFASASNVLSANWQSYEVDFKNGLLGLTTFSYFVKAGQEKIASINVIVRDDARMWHLWHEYTHVLIGEARAKSPSRSLYLPSEKFLAGRLAKLKEMDRTSEDYGRDVQALVLGYRDRIDKGYIDELLIEATLVQLTSQHRDELQLANEDYFRTMGAMDFFMQRYNGYLSQVRSALDDLLTQNDDNEEVKMTLVRAITDFGDQHRRIVDITNDATTEASNQLF